MEHMILNQFDRNKKRPRLGSHDPQLGIYQENSSCVGQVHKTEYNCWNTLQRTNCELYLRTYTVGN